MTTPSGGGNAGAGGWYQNSTQPGGQHSSSPQQVYNAGYGQPIYTSGTPVHIQQRAAGHGQYTAHLSTPGSHQRAAGQYATHYGTPSTSNSGSMGPDIQTVLIALAENNICAAHANGYAAAMGKPLDAHAYCKLMATGLSCLESVLQYRLQPRVEAAVRLRYATILCEETDNVDEAEDALNKGLLLAGRNNLIDIKHNMQHLLTRVMFKTSPKAAMKMLATYTSDVETLDLSLWSYTFRFLRFSLLMGPSLVHDEQLAISTLQKIGSLSKSREDYTLTALSSIMEAMIYLLPGVDSAEAAQRALANAYSQMNTGILMPAQIEVLIHLLDIICSLMTGKTHDCEMKIKKLHAMLDEAARWVNWREDGEFELTVHSNRQGRPPDILRFQWLNKNELFSLGYFLSGLAKFQTNVDENGKAELFLNEGVKTTDRVTDQLMSTPTSMEAAKEKIVWKKKVKCYMWIYHCFLLCVRTDWDTALKLLKQIKDLCQIIGAKGTPLGHLNAYLNAVVCQGTNDLYMALTYYAEIYNSTPTESELSIISKLNAILILRIHDPQQAEALMSSIEKLCPQHKNENIRAAYITVKATERGELVKTKNYLSLALRYATAATNQQLTYLVLSFMCSRFFAGVVSEQAEKSAKAAWQNAKKGRDNLWTLMGGEMVADCLSRKGNIVDATRQREQNSEYRSKVILNLTRHSEHH